MEASEGLNQRGRGQSSGGGGASSRDSGGMSACPWEGHWHLTSDFFVSLSAPPPLPPTPLLICFTFDSSTSQNFFFFQCGLETFRVSPDPRVRAVTQRLIIS